MENPEEVLQALDEFQKLRPSEIPRELEEYLCFVAKTGDPVYQWSLIKPLFREKLVRVMTDFYETSPTLDLAPSPNIEQFNYDNMKGNLLELLESFANAPFTVQRICELLTAPRREYNRVDKFMRAIEKNILVVSTREPGPAARRSENGDSMINGSLDDEAQPHEIEMESWVKDCTSDSAPEPKSPKAEEPADKVDPDVNNFPELSTGALNHEASSAPQIVAADVSSIVGDVPEAIMNEDTSSQPSLETEDDGDSSNSRKLQTTFQARDFGKEEKVDKSEEKCEEIEEKCEDVEEKCEDVEEKCDDSDRAEEDAKVDDRKSTAGLHEHPDLSIEDHIAEKRAKLDDGVDVEPVEAVEAVETEEAVEAVGTVEAADPVIPEVCTSPEKKDPDETVPEEPDASPDAESADPSENSDSSDNSAHSGHSGPADGSDSSSSDVKGEESKETADQEAEAESIVEKADSQVEPEHEAIETDFQELPEYQTPKASMQDSPSTPVTSASSPDEDTISEAKPIVEEPVPENLEEKADEAEDSEGVVIQEAMEDDARSANTLIPDPIPIVEEPKEEPPVPSGEETTIAEIVEAKSPVQVIDEVSREAEDTVADQLETDQLETDQLETDQLETDQLETAQGTTEEPMEKELPESMDVDSEDAMPVIQQDEPMEEECDQLKS